jgi:hypothetical protein
MQIYKINGLAEWMKPLIADFKSTRREPPSLPPSLRYGGRRKLRRSKGVNEERSCRSKRSVDPERSVGASHRIHITPCYSVFTPCDSVVNSLLVRG